jgi:hypothetical protein
LSAYIHARNKLKTSVLYRCDFLLCQCSQRVKLKRKIRVYTSDWVQTPIVCGLIQPGIILPAIFERDLSESEINHIIIHELIHIKRFDYLIKPSSVLALCIHWFNPIIWLGFILSQKDMEMSCDEKVISVLGHDIRNEYATSLIRLAVKQNRMLDCGLLAFDENNIKSRIKRIMNFKKPGFWMVTVSIVLLIALGVILLTNGSGQFDGSIVNKDKTSTGAAYYVENGEYHDHDIQEKEAVLVPSPGDEAATEITSINLIQPDGRSPIKAELRCGKDITLRLGTLEAIVKTGLNGIDISVLKERYSLVDVGDGIVGVIEKVLSARGECIVVNFYKYNDEHIGKVWSNSDLSAQIQNISEGHVELYFPKYDFKHELQLTKDEMNHWEQKAAELKDNNIKIDDGYYSEIKDNLLIDAIAYHITNLDDSGEKKVMILSEVRTVGAKTPYIRGRAVITIKNNNGVLSMEDIVFERESTKGESLFDYFS